MEKIIHIKICDGLYMNCFIDKVSEDRVTGFYRFGRLISGDKINGIRASLHSADSLTTKMITDSDYVFYTLSENNVFKRVDKLLVIEPDRGVVHNPPVTDLDRGMAHNQYGLTSGKCVLRLDQQDAEVIPSTLILRLR